MTNYAGDLTPQQAWDLLADNPDARLVDVRTDAEWRFVGVPDTSTIGHEPLFLEWVGYPDGARNAGFVEQLKAAGIEPGSQTPLIFLCRSGGRSISAAVAATEANLGPAYNILDGFEGPVDEHGHRRTAGWRNADLPWFQG